MPIKSFSGAFAPFQPMTCPYRSQFNNRRTSAKNFDNDNGVSGSQRPWLAAIFSFFLCFSVYLRVSQSFYLAYVLFSGFCFRLTLNCLICNAFLTQFYGGVIIHLPTAYVTLCGKNAVITYANLFRNNRRYGVSQHCHMPGVIMVWNVAWGSIF